jgi:hypothetical protein
MWKVHLIELIEGIRFTVTLIATSQHDAEEKALAAIHRICPTAILA